MNKPPTPKISRWLKDPDYLRCHLALRKWSNEYAVIQAHLAGTGFFGHEQTSPLRVLSIGCGSGEMDLPWIRQMTQRGIVPHYVALDPNAHSLASFEAAALPSLADAALTLEFFTGKYEDFAPQSPFDRIILMHSLYHFPERAAIVRKALSELAPQGRLMICITDDDGLPGYKAGVYNRTEMPARSQTNPGSDLRGILAELAVSVAYTTTVAQTDVTECLQLTPDGISLLDFFFLCRFEALLPEQQATLLNELPQHCQHEGGRLILHQTILFAEISVPQT